MNASAQHVLRTLQIGAASLVAFGVLAACGTSTSSDKPSATTTTADDAKLLVFDGGNGVLIQSSADAEADLDGTSSDFKNFISEQAADAIDQAHKDFGDTGGECVEQAGVTVMRYRTDGFASGTVGSCAGYTAVWADVDGTWTEVVGGQAIFDCTTLKKYAVPADVLGGGEQYCGSASGEAEPYTQK